MRAETATAKPALLRVTPRSFAIAVATICGVVFFIHWAELVLGSRRGHSALANTSIPLGTFTALLIITAANAALRRLRPRLALTHAELMTVYSLTAVTTVLASSGAVHFLVPAVASTFYFPSPENRWEVFLPYVPDWLVPRSQAALRAYFEGGAPIFWRAWLVPSIAWCVFLFLYALASLAIVAAIRAQWIEHERLTFPTVWVPLRITDPRGDFWRRPAAWIGMAIPLFIGLLNNLHENFPAVPKLEVRNINIGQYFRERPWSAMGGLRLSFYPFVVGLAFLLSAEVTFSCWFFYLLTKAQRIFGAVVGLDQWGRGGISRFPFEAHQGAGAFLAITLIAVWIARRPLARAFSAAARLSLGEEDGPVPGWAVWAFGLCMAALVGFCSAAGMRPTAALLLLTLSLIYLMAATRIRAETGTTWLFGPHVDPHTVLMTAIGPRAFTKRDLTVMAYLSTISTYDLRCVSMPHQLDAFKIAEQVRLSPQSLAGAIILSLAIGIPVAWFGALKVWYAVGALAKGEPWRVSQGKRALELLVGYITAPQPPDIVGTSFIGVGFLATALLFAARARFTNWPFHPVGYALANTPSMYAQWFPFFLAWLAKVAILRYGGPRLYHAAVPFFIGLVVGDFINGGFSTLLGCFISSMRVYPINW